MLYTAFNIQFIDRKDITTRFTVANTAAVTDNWKLVLATLSFYTVALMETASTPDGFFTYIKDDQECRKSIPEACVDFIDATTTCYDTSSSSEEESLDESAEEYISSSDDDMFDVVPWAVGTYTQETTNWTATGYTVGELGQTRSFVHNFQTCASISGKITEIIGDYEYTAGNWGDFIESKDQVGVTTETKTAILNLDRFQISIEKENEDIYTAEFTPIPGIHHAASMSARECTVKWSSSKFEPILVLDTIIIRVIARTSEVITIETEYLAMDCL